MAGFLKCHQVLRWDAGQERCFLEFAAQGLRESKVSREAFLLFHEL